MKKDIYINIIYNYLINKHYNYYESCYYIYVYEAIENTLRDLKLLDDIKIQTLENIHKHIKNNYI